jgi:xylose isomerase
MLKKRYESFDSGKGKDFENGKLSLEDLYGLASKNESISAISGKQELLENILFNYVK